MFATRPRSEQGNKARCHTKVTKCGVGTSESNSEQPSRASCAVCRLWEWVTVASSLLVAVDTYSLFVSSDGQSEKQATVGSEANRKAYLVIRESFGSFVLG